MRRVSISTYHTTPGFPASFSRPAVIRTSRLAGSNGSRILPLVLTAHGALGANNSYWPEMYDARGASRSDVEFRRFRTYVAIESALGGFYPRSS